jgi:hypothetical protein
MIGKKPELRKKTINHPNHILSIKTKESKKHDSRYYPPAANKIKKTS